MSAEKFTPSPEEHAAILATLESCERCKRQVDESMRTVCEYLTELAGAAVPATPEPVAVQPPPLKADECHLLVRLAELHPQTRMQTDLAADIDRSRRCVQEALNELERQRLAHRPRGPRSGYALTPLGLATVRGGR